MKVNELIKLLDAGYTREEIQKMEAEKPEEKLEEKPKPEETKPKPEETKPKPEEKPDPVLAELQKLTKAVYAMNVMSSEQPTQKSADDALAELMKGM